MPVDRSAIDAQLREIGEGERWWEQREFRTLPYVLHPDERILGLVNGRLLGARRPRLRPGPDWLLVATDQRLICLKQDRFARRQVEIAAGQVTGVRQSSRLRAYQIVLETHQGRYRIRIAKEDAFRFVGALAPLVANPQAQRIDAELEPVPWFAGMGVLTALPGMSGFVSKVGLLAPPDYASRAHVEHLEATVERLRHDLDRLQQQVAFLEDLMQKRAEEAFLPPSSADS